MKTTGNTGDKVTISRHFKTGEARPEAATVLAVQRGGFKVRIDDGPDAGKVVRITDRNTWDVKEER